MVSTITWLRHYLGWPFIGWLACFSPLILLLLRLNLSSLLEALMLLRTESLLQIFVDATFLTTISLLVSAFGVSMIRILDLYGKTRFDGAEEPMLHDPTAAITYDRWWWKERSTGWPTLIKAFWYLPTLVLIISMIAFTANSRGQGNTIPNLNLFVTALAGHAVGLLLALSLMFLASLLRAYFTLGDVSSCGILASDDIATKVAEAIFKRRKVSKSLCYQWPVSWTIPRGFYDAKTRVLLPGHLQVTLLLIVAAFVYLCIYSVSSIFYTVDGSVAGGLLPVSLGIYRYRGIRILVFLSTWLAYPAYRGVGSICILHIAIWQVLGDRYEPIFRAYIATDSKRPTQ